MRATRLRIVAHTLEDADCYRMREELTSSVSNTSSPHLIDEVLSGALSEVLSLEIFRIYKRACPFSSSACVIIGTEGVDEALTRLLCDAARVGVFEGDDNENAFSAQLLSQPTSGDASIGFNVLRRGQIMEGLVDFSHISNITSLSIRSCGRTLHVVVGAQLTPTSLALIRSCVHGLVVLQASGSDERKGDVLAAASDLRALCFDCEDANYELETLEALTAVSDPVSALELYCRGKASSQALSDELSRIISLLKSTDVRGSHHRAVKDVDYERGNSLGIRQGCSVAVPSSTRGGADLLRSDEGSHLPLDLMNEAVSAVANETASYVRNQVSRTESPAHTENGQPTIARISTSTSLNSVGIPRLTSYIPPAPFRTEVVLASTGW